MNFPDDQLCDECHKPFTLMDWIDRHEENLENLGDDMFPEIKIFHQEWCPSCFQFWGNLELSEDMGDYL